MKRVLASSVAGLIVMLFLGTGCGGQKPVAETPIAPPTADPEAPVEGSAPPAAAEVITRSQPPSADTPLTKVGKLTAQDSASEITVRSQPTTESSEVGFGSVGDAVTVLESTAAADGLTWHRVQFETTDQEGWIRGDFVELPTVMPVATAAPQPTAPTAATASAPTANPETANPVLAVLQATCGSPDQLNAYYTTAKYNIYICNAADGYRYVGHQKGTQETLVAQTVTASGKGFMAENDTYRFAVDHQTLKVFEGDNPDPVVVESVESAQLYE